MADSNIAMHLVPDLPDSLALLPWLQRIDAQRWYTNYGPLVQEFEQGLTALLQRANQGHALALTTLATGYHALEFGLRVLDLPAGAPVLMPAVTFPACPLAALNAGLQPVLADIDDASWQLTPETARPIALRHKIAAVMPVATYGVPVDAAAWDEFTRETGIPVLIDAAAAVETQPLMQQGLVAHSLHATKPFGIGEGGILVGPNAPQIMRARELSNFGTRERIAHSWGSNAKLSEFHAAVGLAQLQRWPDIKQRRRALLHEYRAALAGLPLTLQHGLDQAVPSLLMLTTGQPAQFVMRALERHGIKTHQTYLPPLYRHPAFALLPCLSLSGAKVKSCDNAETFARYGFGIPFHSFMTKQDVQQVAAALRAALN